MSGRADHAVPSLRIGIADLRRRPGNRRRVERDVDLGPVATSTAAVDPDGRVHLDVELESLSDGLVVSGTLSVPWTGSCRRCLEPAGGVVEAPVREVFADRPEDEEVLALDGDALDLGPVVHDHAVLVLPLAPLCGATCPGPDPDDFPVSVEGERDEPRGDPRWAALDELHFDAEDPDSLT